MILFDDETKKLSQAQFFSLLCSQHAGWDVKIFFLNISNLCIFRQFKGRTTTAEKEFVLATVLGIMKFNIDLLSIILPLEPRTDHLKFLYGILGITFARGYQRVL